MRFHSLKLNKINPHTKDLVPHSGNRRQGLGLWRSSGRVRLAKALLVGAIFIFAFFYWQVSSAAGQEFYVESGYQPQGLGKINASLKYTSNRAYFFIEDNWFNNIIFDKQQQASQTLTSLGSEFDKIIYPKETAVFGSEWSPGIDKDPKITVLITEMTQAPGGYFNPNDEYLKEEIGRSNQREMVYLNALYFFDNKIPAFLAHEFQHLITYNQKDRLRNITDEVWLNEARSEYAPTLCGYNDVYDGSNLARRVEHFLAQPSDSLTHWQNDAYDYGSVSLFIHYLVDHYGEGILSQMMQTEKTGADSINWALESLGYLERFEDIFSNWLLANLINNCNVGVGQEYCYLNPHLNYQNLHIEFAAATGPAVSSAEFIRLAQNWSGNWYRFTAKPRLQARYLSIKFDGAAADDFGVFYVVTDKQGRQYVASFGLDNRQGLVNVNDFGIEIEQVDVVVSRLPDDDASSSLSLRSFTLKVATHDGVYGPLLDDALTLEETGRVYLIRDGQRQWINSASVFTSYYDWSAIKPATNEDLFFYQETRPVNTFSEGTLLKAAGQDRVYVISGGRRCWIGSYLVFEALGYSWNQIIEVSEIDLDRHSLGQAVVDSSHHPEGSLIKGSSAAVYFLQNNKKRPIASIDAFEREQFKWGRILPVTDEELGQYEEGNPII